MNHKIKYVVFLRGINVGGQKLIKMQELARIFRDAGYRDVKTYIQSGNVIFDGPAADSITLTKKIERELLNELGYPVAVALIKLSDLEAIVKRDPFKKFATTPDAVPFVVFLRDQPAQPLKLPLISTTENVEIFKIKDRVAFTISRPKKNGRYGFPNAVVEKQLGIATTTRNWSTVQKIVLAANQS